jgi:pimeloyl-ACP methyl ester carboxylesterase
LLLARLGPLKEKDIVFIWGERDGVVPISGRAELAREFPKARFLVIPNTGHLPYEESPQEFNQMLRECLQG